MMSSDDGLVEAPLESDASEPNPLEIFERAIQVLHAISVVGHSTLRANASEEAFHLHGERLEP